MNIFALDYDPYCGKNLMDKHVVKMPLETAQMLSTALRVHGVNDPRLYKEAYMNHPCTIWARKTRANFQWLCLHGLSICEEYNARYARTHACSSVIYAAKEYDQEIPEGPLTPFACAMPDQYKISEDPVINYRNYYRQGKKHLAEWRGNKPAWYDSPSFSPVLGPTSIIALFKGKQ